MSTTAASPGTTRWDRFLYWAGRFLVGERFEADERTYKIEVFERLADAKRAFEAEDPGWIDLLNYAITAKPNNLTNWRATHPLVAWFRENPDSARLAFRFLWDADAPVAHRFDQFTDVVKGPALRVPISELSFFHTVMDHTAYPVYRPVAVERAMDLTGYPEPKEAGIKSGELGRRYEHYLRFLDIMIKRGSEAGIGFRDRLDAQGASWTVTQWHPERSWSEADKVAFLAYQGHAAMRKKSWDTPA